MKRFTVYIMGHKPPGWVPDKRKMEELINAADFCVANSYGVEVGQSFTIGETVYPGRNGVKPPVPGSSVKVVEVKEQGKVAVIEVLSEPS
jgi:hypothetical protein